MRRTLRLLQLLFPLWLLGGVAWGYLDGARLAPGQRYIPEALAAIMLGMGLTLTPEEVAALRHAGRPVVVGALLQYTVMPLVGATLAWLAGLEPAIALGVVLVGAAPGGTASNVITYLARGDVALSVAMTTLSTLLAPVVLPFWTWLLASAWVPVDPWRLLWGTVRIVLVPVVLGVAIRGAWRRPPRWLLEEVLPLVAMGVIVWIVAVIVGAARPPLWSPLTLVVVAHNGAGLALGYLGARLMGLPERTRRTIAIEVGMQNSGLAVALARLVPGVAAAQAALPGALFSVWHNLSGPVLAWWWRRDQRRPA